MPRSLAACHFQSVDVDILTYASGDWCIGLLRLQVRTIYVVGVLAECVYAALKCLRELDSKVVKRLSADQCRVNGQDGSNILLSLAAWFVGF